MILFTKSILEQATGQFSKSSSLDQRIVAKYFNPYGKGTWWLMNMDPSDQDYCWGFAEISDFEEGSFLRSDLESLEAFGVPLIERDLHWDPIPAWQLWEEKTGLKYTGKKTCTKEA